MSAVLPYGASRFVLAGASILLVLLAAAPAGANGRGGGAVYTLTNAPAGNAVAVFDRSSDGTLAPAGRFATGGLGTGAGLGSQGALVRSGTRLLAVNAGSNSISMLGIRPDGLRLLDTAPSGGAGPISVTIHRDVAYVVNQGDASTPANIAGFRVSGGELTPLPGSSRPLSAPAPGPAQIEFSHDGALLVVTEKATNRISTYAVDAAGYATGPNAQPSAGQTPFGFALDGGRLIVSEAFGGAPDASVVSSYRLGPDGTISAVTPNAATTETAACWVVITDNGRFTYATNTGSGSVTGYAVARNGALTILDADGRTADTGAGSMPIDAALSEGSRFLYVLEAGSNAISGFRVHADGSLTPAGEVGGLAAGAAGLVAG
jgi:6-phosphogluconolactonase (cycloisomerase 2 family)